MSETLELALQRPPLCPEIELHLLSPRADLETESADLAHEPPYWAFCWASGQALARFVLDHPDCVRGRRVADFGAGSGVAAIAAGLAGAAEVWAWDRDADARAAIERNAEANGLDIQVASGPPPGTDSFDLILASDVCYEAANAHWLRSAPGRELLLSDPGRLPLPFAAAAIAHFKVRTLPDLDEQTDGATVYRLGVG